jgi:hypothetical protein
MELSPSHESHRIVQQRPNFGQAVGPPSPTVTITNCVALPTSGTPALRRGGTDGVEINRIARAGL